MTLKRFLDVVKRRSLIIWSVLAVGLALMYSFRGIVPSSYSGVAHIVLVAASGTRDPSVSIVDLPSIATSTVVLQRVRNSLKLPVSLVNLKSNVSASVLGRSSIMAIGYRDPSAERAIAVSNSVADELSRYYDEISSQSYDVNVSRLSAALADEAAKRQRLNRQMSAVAASDPFVVSDKSADAITGQIADLSEQRAIARAQLQGDQALAATTLPDTPQLSRTARHEILAGDPAYQAARIAAAKDAAQLITDKASYTSAFPGLPGEVAKVQSESGLIDNEASRALNDPNAYSASAAATMADHLHQLAIIVGDKARLQQLDDLIAKETSSLNQVPTVGASYAQLSAQRAAVDTEYTALAGRRADALADRAEASSLGSVVVLDRAIKADTQLAGGRTRVAVVALTLVIALALGTAFLVESLDPRIRRVEDIEELYGIPVVGTFGSKA
jgi:capsular polysaccharide biosynthesis protein